MIHWDSDFDDQLEKLGEYWNGWEVNFYPEAEPPSVRLEPFRQGQSSMTLFNNRGFTLWGQTNSLADASKMKEWLQEREEVLTEIVEGYDTKWNGNNTVGTLTEYARELLDDLQMRMPDAFQYPQDAPQYWDVGDWFMNGNPEPDDRDVGHLVEEAKGEGIYIDPDEVKRYLEELAEEEAQEKAEAEAEAKAEAEEEEDEI